MAGQPGSGPAARLARWIDFGRRVSQGNDRARRVFIGLMALVERLLGPALVYVAMLFGTWSAVAMGAILSTVFALRGLLQNAHTARTESALYLRVVDCILQRDVLQSSVLEDEDAIAALYEGGPLLARFLAEGFPTLCANVAAAAVFAVAIVLTVPPRIVLVAVLSGTAGFLVLLAFRRAADAARQRVTQAWTDLADGIGDAFGGRLEIVAGGRARQYVDRFASTSVQWATATLRDARMSRLAGRLPLLAATGVVGAAVMVDSFLRGMESGRILAQGALLGTMAPAFLGVAHGLQRLAESDRRLLRMLDMVTVEPSGSRGAEHVRRAELVELREVSFAYERGGRQHEALKQVSFAWKQGELLAIRGPNGSGKSTCLRILLGLGRLRGGQVRIDGAGLESIDLDEWRRSVTFLPQNPYLSPRASVRQCLRFVDSDVTDEAMADAIARVGLLELVGRDVKSLLDARADELSVGQRQRVALARLVCRRSPMVLLDEPDSNLDRAGVRMVTELLRELSRDRMVLVASHSPEILAACDRVVSLGEGRVESVG